ncbi:MAG: FAD-binding protein, partial [Clostridia bacterium]|nr:FAD-binding protein [Clostridia bacterium]
MYPEYLQLSLEKVAEKREENIAFQPERMTADEKETLLQGYHPDYRKDQYTELRAGANKGEFVNSELAETLMGRARVHASDLDLNNVDYDVDVLIIGAGGAGCAAAIEADEAGADVLMATKLRLGDANTMMAEGGIQGATKPGDSPAQHFLDAYGGGHYLGKKELVYKLVTEAPECFKWLSDLGVEFDKEEDGTMIAIHGGGTSRKRMHAAKDYTGAEIMRTLRDETRCRRIPCLNYAAVIELVRDEGGNIGGAILVNTNTKELKVVRAKTPIITTGGSGRLHIQGFPTSNHHGATADGLVLAYRVGAPLLFAD